MTPCAAHVPRGQFMFRQNGKAAASRPAFGSGAAEPAVAADRTPQGLWLAPQGVDAVVVVDDMDALPDRL